MIASAMLFVAFSKPSIAKTFFFRIPFARNIASERLVGSVINFYKSSIDALDYTTSNRFSAAFWDFSPKLRSKSFGLFMSIP